MEQKRVEQERKKKKSRQFKKQKTNLAIQKKKKNPEAIPLGVLLLGLEGWCRRKISQGPDEWMVCLPPKKLKLVTSSPNSRPVSQAAFQGRRVLQALHRAMDFKGELKLF